MAFDAGAVEASLTLDTSPFQRSLRTARAQADRFEKEGIAPNVDLQDKLAKAKLELLRVQLERLDHKRVTVDVDVRRGVLERLASIGATAGQGIASGLQSAFGAGGKLFSGIIGGLTALPGLITGAAVVIGIVLIPALLALTASLAAATAGLAILGIGFAAAFGPALLVGVALVQRFVAILGARKAREQELAQAVSQEKTAEQQRQAALEASKSAHQRLAESVVAGRRAMIQSALDLKSAELGLERSRFGVDQAKLNIAQARKDLRDFLREQGASGNQLDALVKRFTNVDFQPGQAGSAFGQTTGKGLSGDKTLELRQKVLNLRGAQLSYKESLNQVTNAEDSLSQAQSKRAEFVQKGIDAYGPYVAALNAVHRADARLLIAQNRQSKAADTYQRKLAALTATEQGTLGVIDKIVKGFTAFAKVLTDPIFRAINDVVGSLNGKFTTLRGPLRQVGEAMGDVVRAFGKFLGERRTITFFREAARTATSLARSLGVRAFPDFLRIMRNLALAVFPSVRRAGDKVADVIHRLFGQTGNANRLRSIVATLVGHLRTWLGIAYQLGRVFIAFIRDAAGQGRHFGNSIRLWLKHLADFLNTKEGRDQVLQWIHNSVGAARNLAKAFRAVLTVLDKIIDAIGWISRNSAKAADALGLGDSGPSAKQLGAEAPGIAADVALLHKHLSDNVRAATRARLLDRLQSLKDRGAHLTPNLEQLRKRLSGVTRGAHASSVGTPGIAGAGGVTIHSTVHSSDPDPQHYASKVAKHLGKATQREAQKRGLR